MAQAFGDAGGKSKFCAIGSVKSNIGHLDTAAGVAGLIKAVLALKNKQLPPSLHYTKPNPKIDFENSPFFVNTQLTDWNPGGIPRRAGVSSFGLGGTNAHVVLEEPPTMPASSASREWQLLLLSAKTKSALNDGTANLTAHFKANPGLKLADVAYTLQVGRGVFGHRRMLVCRNAADAIKTLESGDSKRVFTQRSALKDVPVFFLFPGQGAQYVSMGADLYRTEPVFKEEVDRCRKLLQPQLELDLHQILFPQPEQADLAKELLVQTRTTQPALFVVEYALARLWMSWGIKPKAMIGHSVGEYVAACLAGVFTLEEGLRLVASRARLVQAQPGGVMLAVRLSEDELQSLQVDDLSIGAVNAANLCVVSGPTGQIEKLEKELDARNIGNRRLSTSHAFHSTMMEPVVSPFLELLKKVTFKAPTIPYVSNVTGKWITPAEATDPVYWARHVRKTVRFAEGVTKLLEDSQAILLEVGPGKTLTTLVLQHAARSPDQMVISSMMPGKDEGQEMLNALGKLWLAGATVDWPGFYQQESRCRVALPTYAFERSRFWIEPPAVNTRQLAALANPMREVATVYEVARSALTIEESRNGITRSSRLEHALKGLFEEISGIQICHSSRSEAFVELGFYSLLLAQASQFIQKRFGIEVTFRQLQEELSTLKDLAQYLDVRLPAETPAVGQGKVEEVEIPPASTGSESQTSSEPTIFPLTEGQTELWLAAQLGADASRAFNQNFLLHLRGQLRQEFLMQALQEVVNRHDALRTTFLPDGKEQQIAAHLEIEVPFVDLSSIAEPTRDQKIRELLKEEDEFTFDLAKGPLFRAKIIKVSTEYHMLVISSHHIVMDGWSMGVVFNEVSRIYSAKLEGKAGLLAPAMQFKEYVEWQQGTEACKKSAEAEAYWLRQYETVPTNLELPADNARPLNKTYKAGTECLVISSALYKTLKEATVEQRCTLFTYLLASFNAWLYRLSGQEDIAIGVPTAGQIAAANHGHSGNRMLLGHCVNLLPFRSRCNGAIAFKDYLKEVKRVVLEGYEHQHLTYGRLVNKLNLPRDTSRLPLISMTFNVVQVTNGVHFSGLESEIGLLTKSCNFFDITFDLMDSEKDLLIECRFNLDLFGPGTIKKWLKHWKTMLEAAAANPAQQICAIPLLDEAERKQILCDWNDTDKDYPKSKCLHHLIEAQVERTPKAVAVQFESSQLTYDELNKKANRLAHHLKRLGVGPETLVGLCVDRSLEMVVGLLAILKAGGAYVPLDPHYPKERLAFILHDCRTPVLLTQQRLLESLPKLIPESETSSNAKTPTVICLDSDLLTVEQGDERNPKTTVSAENAIYVIFTSGSTGQPKGVLISHRSFINFLIGMQQEPGLEKDDVILAVTTLSFDPAGLELWLPLVVGAKVVIAKSDVAMDAKRLSKQLAACGATLLQATPATWQLLLDSGWTGSPNLKILCGGEAWSNEMAGQLLPRCRSLWNMYGPTETTVWSAATRVEKAEVPLIGKCIANMQYHVLDSQLQPVPIGVPGELHIGGDGLARGYLNREKLTGERFIPNPFKADPKSRLYKSGDLVRYREDGRIEFLGRMDNQVKIRGHRIELGEIESTLRKHAAVRNVVVAAQELAPGDKRLVAYLVLEESETVTTAALRQFVKGQLPEYMIPSAFMVLEKFPLTPNGKVDRKALPLPDSRRTSKSSVAPRDPLELQLAQIWEKIFNMRDSIAMILSWRHSLLAIRLLLKSRNLPQNLPLVTLFQAPTIEQLAGVLRQQGWESPWLSLVPIKADGAKPPFYCVHGVGGNILEYMDLAKYMDADQPFYGLQAIGLNGKRPWHKSVEEMASHYVEEIKAFQPRGPYYIGGSSFGGLVAFEMAQQLKAKGEEVALLAFFDTRAPGYPRYLANVSAWKLKLNQLAHRVALHWGNFRAARGVEKITYIKTKAQRWYRSQIWSFNRMRRRWKEKFESIFWPKAIKEAQKKGLQAACVYVPSKYDGSATLFRATGQIKGIYPDPTLGWSELIGKGLEIYDTPGHHGAIVREPRARVLAEQLKESLRKTQAAVMLRREHVNSKKPHANSNRNGQTQEPAVPEEKEVGQILITPSGTTNAEELASCQA
ncbi:amino acid adenylation domain protein [Pedosphaera parvula Ellin514]|uniref:Amino acid adenylation domain protein n=2 Tax=Pedosphaera TaxID=1032526 RepID=B9XAZ0_PEDPL|nr:amino acid adenylation domain protein [Pedosphaera parvula Ellin514]